MDPDYGSHNLLVLLKEGVFFKHNPPCLAVVKFTQC